MYDYKTDMKIKIIMENYFPQTFAVFESKR